MSSHNEVLIMKVFEHISVSILIHYLPFSLFPSNLSISLIMPLLFPCSNKCPMLWKFALSFLGVEPSSVLLRFAN